MEDDAAHCEILGVIETHIAGVEHYPARAAVGGKVVGVEVFGTHDVLAGPWERLSEAYFFEAATDPEPVVSGKEVDESDARRFLQTVGAGLIPVDRPVGVGAEFHVNAKNVAGSALWHDGHLLHVAAFEASCQ